METPTPPAAPAPPAATETISASIDAVNRNDFDAFDRAELGKRTGQPVADVDAPEADPPAAATAPGAAAVPERPLSKRQQDINDKIREAVERANADSAKRISDLEAQLRTRPAAAAAAPPPAAADAPPAKTTPEYKRIMALPGAPKLADFDSVEEHAFAAAEFIDSTRTTERERTARTRAGQDAFLASEKAADDAFFGQLDKATAADPEFTKKVAPEVLGLTPIEWLKRDKDGRPIDDAGRPVTTGPRHIVASELRKSPVVRDLMLHFTQHPADLAKFDEMPASVAAIADPRARLHAHVQHIVREFHRLEGRLAGAAAPAASTTASAASAADTVSRSPITAAPPPPPTLRAAGATSDPKAAALARQDFAEFDRLEVQGRMATLTPR